MFKAIVDTNLLATVATFEPSSARCATPAAGGWWNFQRGRRAGCRGGRLQRVQVGGDDHCESLRLELAGTASGS